VEAAVFFVRFLQILQRQGLERDRSETPREFALFAASQLHARLTGAGLAALPEHVAARYYQVRYGEVPLSDEELERLEAELQSLEKCLQPRPNGDRPR
jgi:hypothetical protein